ncbi:MAG: sigma-70 family RNA polymerase sigma factor [Acidobacteria bacterium]|nr:sigma-70 family RNA polymerase sigma factor [Acidobacteriota bacterium]
MHADVADLEAHRAALTGHCYRMLGSSADADDAVQETIVRAWRNLGRFEGRASIRTWLYKIATNVCLDALTEKSRRFRPIEEGPSTDVEHASLETKERTHWLEPIPDVRALPADADPFELASMRQSIRLAFVAALQHLPPRQRAALLLADVLGWSAAETAETIDTTVASVNSALQRARATLAARNADAPSSAELDEEQMEMLDRYVDAFQRYDVDRLVSLVRDDVAFSMPPYSMWLQGPDPIRDWLLGPGAPCRGSRIMRVSANGSPAFAQYRKSEAPGAYHAWALIVLELDGSRIASWTNFLDVETLFPMFGLAMDL